MACINVIAADTDEEANYLASSFYKLASGIVTNLRKPLQPPSKNFLKEWDEYEKAAVLQMMKYTFIGSQATVKKDLESFLDDTQVDEIMVASYIYDNDAKIYSYELVGELFKKENKEEKIAALQIG